MENNSSKMTPLEREFGRKEKEIIERATARGFEEYLASHRKSAQTVRDAYPIKDIFGVDLETITDGDGPPNEHTYNIARDYKGNSNSQPPANKGSPWKKDEKDLNTKIDDFIINSLTAALPGSLSGIAYRNNYSFKNRIQIVFTDLLTASASYLPVIYVYNKMDNLSSSGVAAFAAISLGGIVARQVLYRHFSPRPK